MKSLFIGLIFIFIDFNLTLNETMVINLIPDFVGFILMYQGLTQLTNESERFFKMKPYAIGMAIYSGFLFILNFLGFPSYVSMVLGIVSMAVTLYILYNIVMGIRDIEIIRNFFLNSAQLMSYWQLSAIFSGITYFLMLFLPALSIFSALIELVVMILFLVAFNKSKNLYISQTGNFAD